MGNPLTDGTWTYTWQHGRQLASMEKADGTKWEYTYNSDGLRTQRTNGTTAYNYVYNGSQLAQMTVGSDVLSFAYDAAGIPLTVTWNGTAYYYSTNIQGDIIAILNSNGETVVTYTYDAWGFIYGISGDLVDTLGKLNPLRYRGYVYDTETGLYYLQTRYYNPEIGRFINADAYTSTGQGFVGNNMFACCGNNPMIFKDPGGESWLAAAIEFLNTWIFGDGSTQYYFAGSNIVRALQESQTMQEKIDEAIQNYMCGIETTSGTGEFLPDTDGYELYLSTQKFRYSINVQKTTKTTKFIFWEIKKTTYTATVIVNDNYNFDSYREWNSFGNIANNVAFLYNKYLGGNDFEWFAIYTHTTHTTQWEWIL